MNTVRTPTADFVTAACKEFDQQNLTTEQALKELFSRYPGNSDHPQVLLKVVALNRLYSTQIFAVHDVARHIHQQARDVDSALANGSPEIVDRIARVTLSINGKVKNNYSFATKYCSWHSHSSYPIFDSRVETYLWSLRKQDPTLFDANAHLRDYATFLRVMTTLRDRFGLGAFTFKEIDKFIWLEGRGPDPVST
jgi:hypothetical protein